MGRPQNSLLERPPKKRAKKKKKRVFFFKLSNLVDYKSMFSYIPTIWNISATHTHTHTT